MKEDNKINWGISKDLQADIRYEPNACKGFVMDLSLGCPHHCTYCLFSPLELRVYKLQNPGYKGNVLPLKLDNFLKERNFRLQYISAILQIHLVMKKLKNRQRLY